MGNVVFSPIQGVSVIIRSGINSAVLPGYFFTEGMKNLQDASTGLFTQIHDDEREVRYHQFTLFV